MARILLVRHAQTKLNNDERFWGKTDLSLSDYGEWQAGKLRDRLAEESIDAVYTSTLSRAHRTGEIITSGRDCPIIACEEITEVNFGFVEGLTYDEIKQQYPDLAEVLSGFGTIIQFPGGESFNDLNDRVKAFVARLAGHQSDETVLVVSHGGPLPLIICHLLAIGAEHWRKIWLELASLSIIYTYPEGVRISLLNDISHLKT